MLGVVGDLDKWAEARGESVFSSKQPLESRMEEQRKRLRLDESYAPIPHAAPALTAEQVATPPPTEPPPPAQAPPTEEQKAAEAEAATQADIEAFSDPRDDLEKDPEPRGKPATGFEAGGPFAAFFAAALLEAAVLVFLTTVFFTAFFVAGAVFAAVFFTAPLLAAFLAAAFFATLRPLPLRLPPPSCLLTVAQAMRSAALSLAPRSRSLSSMCSAWRFCFSV